MAIINQGIYVEFADNQEVGRGNLNDSIPKRNFPVRLVDELPAI
jgi:hypothetical protein